MVTRTRSPQGLLLLAAFALAANPAYGSWEIREIVCGRVITEDCPPATWVVCQCIYPKPDAGLTRQQEGWCAPPAYHALGPKTIYDPNGTSKYMYDGQRWCLMKYECRPTAEDFHCCADHPCRVVYPPEFLGVYDKFIDLHEDC